MEKDIPLGEFVHIFGGEAANGVGQKVLPPQGEQFEIDEYGTPMEKTIGARNPLSRLRRYSRAGNRQLDALRQLLLMMGGGV